MTRLTDERIAEIEARLANTTPGQRNVHKRKDGSLCVSLGNPEHGPHQQADLYFSEGEADFFTQGKFDVEDLLAEVKALKAENESMAKEHKRELALAIDDYYCAWGKQQSEMEQLKRQLAQAEAERDVLLHELLKETHSHLCEDPERPCPFDEETEGKCCSNECANADPETCWLKYAQQQAEREGVSK